MCVSDAQEPCQIIIGTYDYFNNAWLARQPQPSNTEHKNS